MPISELGPVHPCRKYGFSHLYPIIHVRIFTKTMEQQPLLKGSRLALNPYLPPSKINYLKSMIHDLQGEIVMEWSPETICISDSLSLPPQLERHFDQVKLATSKWVEAIHKHQKLYSIDHYSPDPKQIFSGFIVHGHKVFDFH
jgi:hypothetical protein